MKMKKLCAFVAAGMLALSLVACTDGNEPAKTATEQTQAESTKAE